MVRYHYLQTHIDKIKDRELQALLDEIYSLRSEPKEGMVIHFLTQSLHPGVEKKRKPFDRHEFIFHDNLMSKLTDLKETAIYKLCYDLTRLPGNERLHLENLDGTRLYVFLNKAVPKLKGRSKSK